MQTCPCSSDLPFADCCEPHTFGKVAAPTAEALMRSRYAAFAIGSAAPERRATCISYLVATHHPSHRDPDLMLELRQMMPLTTWLGLEVLEAHEDEDAAEVEFVARFEQAGVRGELSERSSFVRSNGRWFYTTGTFER